MKQNKSIYYLLAALLTLVSCKSDEDVWQATLYGDASINSFTLGTLNRYIAGEKTTYAGSSYTMRIDPLTRTIENPDSLPIYTDNAHVICSIGTLNNGALFLKSLTDDTFPAYTSTDSIDFTQNRIFRVWASDGSGYNDYTVKVNVHKEDGELMVWSQQTSVPWTDTTPAGIAKYLGASSYEEYGLSADGKLMAKAKDGTEWLQDIDDDHEDAEHFPTKDIALTSYAMTTADSTDYVLLVGTRDDRTVVWRKIVDNTGKKAKGDWVYMDRGSETVGLLPALTKLNLIRYDGVSFAFGGDLKTIYVTRDNGITWQSTNRIYLPVDFLYDNIKTLEVRTDDNNYVWIRCTYSDSPAVGIWRGRLNRLGWKK